MNAGANTVNGVNGGSSSQGVTRDQYFEFARKIRAELNIDLFVYDSHNRPDANKTLALIKKFFDVEGIAYTPESVDEYISWIKLHKEEISSIEAFQNASQITVFDSYGSRKLYRSGYNAFVKVLAEIYPHSQVKPGDQVKELLAARDAFLTGIRFVAVQKIDVSNISQQEAQKYFAKARDIKNWYGVELFVYKDGSPIREASLVKIISFLRAFNLENEDSYKAFAEFSTNLTKGETAQKYASLTLIAKAYLFVNKAGQARPEGVPEFAFSALTQAKAIDSFKSLTEKIARGYNLLVVKRGEGPGEKLEYYWQAMGVVSRVSLEEQKIIDQSIIPILLRGKITPSAQGEEIKYLENFLELKGSDLSAILAVQAILQKISPNSIRAFAKIIAEGKSVESLLQDIKNLNKSIETAVARYKAAAGQFQKSRDTYEQAAQEANDSITTFQGNQNTDSRNEAIYDLNQATDAQNNAQADLDAANQSAEQLNNQVKRLKAQRNALCKQLNIDIEGKTDTQIEEELNKVVTFLEVLQNQNATSSLVDLNKVADSVENYGAVSGLELKNSDSIVGLFDLSVSAKVLAPTLSEHKVVHIGSYGDVEDIGTENERELLKHPIILIKTAGAGIENSPYHFYTSREYFSSQELLYVADCYSPRYKINNLTYPEVKDQMEMLNLLTQKVSKDADLSESQKTILRKLYLSLKDDRNTYYTREELDSLKAILTKYAQGNDKFKTLYDKIFTDGKYTFRVECTRSGLSREDAQLLKDYATTCPNCKITTLLPQEGDSDGMLKVKLILQTIAKQLGAFFPEKSIESVLDLFTFVVDQFKNAGETVSDEKLPQGAEEQVWLNHRFMSMSMSDREKFNSALANLRLTEKAFKKAIEELTAAKEAYDSAPPAKQAQLKAEFEAKKKAFDEARAASLKAQEEFQSLVHSLRLNGRVTKADLLPLLNESNIRPVLAYLDSLMVDQYGRRLNIVENIDTVEELRAFILGQLAEDGWDSLIADPGESMKLTIAKKLASLIVTQAYFTKIRQEGSLLAPLYFVPFGGVLKIGAMVTGGVAAYIIDEKSEGTSSQDQLTFPDTYKVPFTDYEINLYKTPFVNQVVALSQHHQSAAAPNKNISPYIHMLLVRFGRKDRFHVFQSVMNGDFNKISKEDLLAFIEGLFETIKTIKNNPALLAKFESLIPAAVKPLWNKIKNMDAQAAWKEYFEGKVDASGSFELMSGSPAGRMALNFIQLAGSMFEAESAVINPATQGVSGDHINYTQVHNTVKLNGVTFVKSQETQEKVVGMGSTEDNGFVEFGYGLFNTAGLFTSMQFQFAALAIDYTEEYLQAFREAGETGNWDAVFEATKKFIGLMSSVISWSLLPIPYIEEPIQLWKEGKHWQAIGETVVIARMIIDVARMWMYQGGRALDYMMDRPTVGCAPLTFWNSPVYLVTNILRKPLALGIDTIWSPEDRMVFGNRADSSLLLGIDYGADYLGSQWGALGERVGKLWLGPSPRKRALNYTLGMGKTILADWTWKGVLGLGFIREGITSANAWLDEKAPRLNMSNVSKTRQRLNRYGQELDRVGSYVKFMSANHIPFEKITMQEGAQLTIEKTNGKLIYKNGDPVIFKDYESVLKLIPSKISASWEGSESHEITVKEIKVVDGSGINIEVYRGHGGGEYVRVVIGRGALNEQAVKDSFAAKKVFTLNATEGGIYDGLDVADTSSKLNPPYIRLTGNHSDHEVQINEREYIDRTAKNIDTLYKMYSETKEISLSELESAASKDVLLKANPDFEKLSINEQRAIMENTKVTIHGKEYTYLEARMTWTRALIQKNHAKHRTLTTAQIKAILLMHDGYSAQILTGEGKTLITCAVNILDAPTGRQMISITFNDLTAEQNYKDTRAVYEAAHINAKNVAYTDAGLHQVFEKNQVIYLSMTDLAFIHLNNRTAVDKSVNINWTESLFRLDEFDFLFVDEGGTPYVLGGGEEAQADVKAWRNANKTAVDLINNGFAVPVGEGKFEILVRSKKRFLNSKGISVTWDKLTEVEQRRITLCLQAQYMKIGDDYEINRYSHDIIIRNKSTNQMSYGSSFSFGLQQALQAKHEGFGNFGTKITPESTIVAQVFGRRVMNMMRNVNATSGTLNEIDPILHKIGVYYLEVETSVPRYTWDSGKSYMENVKAINRVLLLNQKNYGIKGRDLQINGKPEDVEGINIAREYFASLSANDGKGYNLTMSIYHPLEMSNTREEKINSIVKSAIADIKLGRPVVISADEPDLALEVYRRLKNNSELNGKNIKFLGHGEEGQYGKIFDPNKTLDGQGIDILVTTLARRATDVSVTNEKGAILYLIDQNSGSWGEMQKLGRVPRMGQNGDVKFFSSTDCLIYSAKLGETGLELVKTQFGQEFIEENKFTAESTYKEVLEKAFALEDFKTMQIGEQGVEFANKTYGEDIVKKHRLSANSSAAELIKVFSQLGYDQVLFEKWEMGAKTEYMTKVVDTKIIDPLFGEYGTGVTKQSIYSKCERVVVEDLRFIWKSVGGDPEGKVDFSKPDQRTLVEKMFKVLERMYGVEIKLTMPQSGIYSFNELSQKVASAVSQNLFDYKSMRAANLVQLLNNEYLKFEMEVLELREMLVRKYNQEGKIIASESNTTVREAFLKEYEERLANLIVDFRKRFVESVMNERAIKSLVVFGRHTRGPLGRTVKLGARIAGKVPGAHGLRNWANRTIQLGLGNVLYSNNQFDLTVSKDNLDVISRDGLLITKQGSDNVVLLKRGENNILLLNFGANGIDYEDEKIVITQGSDKIALTIDEFKERFGFESVSDSSPMASRHVFKNGRGVVKAQLYERKGQTDNYQAVIAKPHSSSKTKQSGDAATQANPSEYRVDPNKTRNWESLVKEIENAPSGATVICESPEKIALKGKTQDFKAWIDNPESEEGRAAFKKIVLATKRANPNLPNGFIEGFLLNKFDAIISLVEKATERNINIKMPLFVYRGTKEELLQKFTTFEYSYENENGEKVSVRVKISDANDLVSENEETRNKAKERILSQIKEQQPSVDAESVFKGIEGQVQASKTTETVQLFLARKAAGIQKESHRAHMKYSKTALASANSTGRQTIMQEIQVAMALELQILQDAFAKAVNEYIEQTGKRSLTQKELSDIWDRVKNSEDTKEQIRNLRTNRQEIYKYRGSAAWATIKGTGIAGATGLIVSGILELPAFLKGDVTFSEYCKDMGQEALGWARFGAMAGASEHFIKLSHWASTGIAMALPALWDLHNENLPFEQKGSILFSHAVGAGAFFGGEAVARKVFGGLIRRIPLLGQILPLAGGILGSELTAPATQWLYQNSSGFRDVMESRAMNITGDVLGSTSPFMTTSAALALGGSVFTSVSVGLIQLDAVGVMLGVPATLGGASTFFGGVATGFSILGAGALGAGLAVGGINLYYDVTTSDYENDMNYRIGKPMYERFVSYDSTASGAVSLFVADLAPGFKYGQIIGNIFDEDKGGLATLDNKDRTYFYQLVKDTAGADFNSALSLSDGFSLSYSQIAITHLDRTGQITGNEAEDYEKAVEYLKTFHLDGLTKRIELSEEETVLYVIVSKLLSAGVLKGFNDPALLETVKKFCENEEELKKVVKDIKGSDAHQSEIVKLAGRVKSLVSNMSFESSRLLARNKFEIINMQQLAKSILLVNPKEMGEKLYKMIVYWSEHANDPANPFKNTALMSVKSVQALHDIFKKFFNNDGTLKADQKDAFARWLLNKESVVAVKDQTGHIVKKDMSFGIAYKQTRANNLIYSHVEIGRLFYFISMANKEGENYYLNKDFVEEQDLRTGLVVKTESGEYMLNRENKYFIAWKQSGIAPEQENVHKLLKIVALPGDYEEGLIDENGYLNIENPTVKEAVDEICKSTARSISVKIERENNEYNTAETKAKDLQDKLLKKKQELYDEMAKEEPNSETIERLKAEIAKLEKAIVEALNEVAAAAAKKSVNKLAVMRLQVMWYETKDPFLRKIIEAQIAAYGPSVQAHFGNIIDREYYTKIKQFINNFEKVMRTGTRAQKENIFKKLESFEIK